MKNYVDHGCSYGYMTVCIDCLEIVPHHVDVKKEVQGFPIKECEICGRKAPHKRDSGSTSPTSS